LKRQSKQRKAAVLFGKRRAAFWKMLGGFLGKGGRLLGKRWAAFWEEEKSYCKLL